MVKTSSTTGGTSAFLCNLVSNVHVAHKQEEQDSFISIEEKMKGMLLSILREHRRKQASKTNIKTQSQLEGQPHPECMWPDHLVIEKVIFSNEGKAKLKLYLTVVCRNTYII